MVPQLLTNESHNQMDLLKAFQLISSLRQLQLRPLPSMAPPHLRVLLGTGTKRMSRQTSQRGTGTGNEPRERESRGIERKGKGKRGSEESGKGPRETGLRGTVLPHQPRRLLQHPRLQRERRFRPPRLPLHPFPLRQPPRPRNKLQPLPQPPLRPQFLLQPLIAPLLMGLRQPPSPPPPVHPASSLWPP